ncbi:MAG TPA: hypothetical protein VLT86_07200 [Vicinamibacterales bacterium]|nr:hypothetical protein [Vicinamibacterales bacterium]
MRRPVILISAVVLLTLAAPRPAAAGPWSAFVAWLSDLDPKSGGIGMETALCRSKPVPQGVDPASVEGQNIRTCTYPAPGKLLVRANYAVTVGAADDQGARMYTVPVTFLAEYRPPSHEGNQEPKVMFLPAAGAGFIVVGGIPAGDLTRFVFQLRATLRFKGGAGVRVDYNLIPQGFPAGAFSAGSPKTGAESVWGIAFVFLR